MLTRKRIRFGFAVIVFITAIGTSIQAAPSIKLVPVLTGLNSPILVTNARDGSGRLFIVEQPGVIKVLQPGETSPSVFLDITSKVRWQGEQGLLGLTFHPQFSSDHRFFVDYTRQADGATVIAEYHVSPSNPNNADTAETVLLVIPQPFENHNGGMVEFGPDGFLYIGMGDGGAANDPGNRAQDINSLLGKILRIDVDHPNGNQLYSSPPGNPFFGATPGADEIYADGLRNPWRFSFDRSTGDLYAGDVGQNLFEEIDIITLGGNYGWRIWEAAHCSGNDPDLCGQPGVIFPIAEYGHPGGRCAVTGGYVYRGAQASLPAGSYVYGDFCSGEIFVLKNGTSRLALRTALNISSFGEDESGEIYVVGIGGTVFRIASSRTEIDFNKDGMSDILWQHTDGSATMWLMNGLNIVSAAGLLGGGNRWNVNQIGDFNGDGLSDILWQHTDGSVAMWLMNGLSVVDNGGLLGAGTGWSVKETGDFNGDGMSDILWQHTDGNVVMWLMNGLNAVNAGELLEAGTGWSVKQIGDFNGDGMSDILWQHTDGSVAMWLMDGLSLQIGAVVLGPGTGWSPNRIGDFNGDGKSDILWQHTDGSVAMWLMNGLTSVSAAGMLSAGTGWSVKQIGDFNGDGKSDILWQHTDESTAMWLMNGLTPVSAAGL
jgi:glucose/arabinose dehydrogenase